MLREGIHAAWMAIDDHFTFRLDHFTWMCSAPATYPGMGHEGQVFLVALC